MRGHGFRSSSHRGIAVFFKYQIQPGRMERLFASFGRQAVRIDCVRRLHMLGIVVGLPIFGFAVATLLGSPSRFGLTSSVVGYFWGLFTMGLLFLGIGWIVSSYRSRPRQPFAFGGAEAVLLMVGGSLGLVCFYTPILSGTGPWLMRLGRDTAWLDVWAAWTLAGAGVLLASRFIVWLRLGQARVQLGELESLKRTVVPLLRDLPQDASCSLVCNPYPPRWTVTPRIVNQGGRVLGIYDDMLLDFRVVLPGGEACTVQNSHRRIDKYKVRKQKFKGRKHVVAQRILFERPGCGPLEGRAIVEFEHLAKQLAVNDPTCVSMPTHEATDGVLRLSLKRKWKFSHSAEQPADKLPDPTGTLAVVRSLSHFAAGLGG